MITIGIDPHKSSHTAVALDETGAMLGELRVLADSVDAGAAAAWAAGWPQRVWAIEGASGLGRLLAQQLVAAGETVVDVPSALAARTRVLQRGHGRKSDGIDARSVAVVAQHRDDLSRVAPDDHSAVLRLLSDRRDELTSERRRTVNRLHRLLRDLRPGGAPRQLSADRASRLLADDPACRRRRHRTQGDGALLASSRRVLLRATDESQGLGARILRGSGVRASGVRARSSALVCAGSGAFGRRLGFAGISESRVVTGLPVWSWRVRLSVGAGD